MTMSKDYAFCGISPRPRTPGRGWASRRVSCIGLRRLTKALDWRRTSRPDLTVTEITFLDRSAAVRDAEHDAADEQQRTAARSRRRTKMLVTGVAGLLVAALVAGLLALNQQWRREDADLAAACGGS